MTHKRPGGYLWELAKFTMGFAVGLLMLIPIAVVLPSRPQSPVVELVAHTYEEQSGCPGQIIDNYTITWNVRRASVIVVTSTHLRQPNGDTASPQRAGNRAVMNIYEPGIIEDLDARFTIPGSLTPGVYEYVLSVGTESESSDPAFLVLPYTVRDDCGN